MRAKVWSNTFLLDGSLIDHIRTDNPSSASFAVLGSKPFHLGELPNLRAVFRCGVGTENIDFVACAARGVHVQLPSPGSQNLIFEETSSFAVKSILDGLYRWQGEVESWSKSDRRLLSERKVLLLGQGNIGTRVRNKLEPLVTVLSWDPAFDSSANLKSLLEEAEVVSLHMPLNADTRGWFNADLLGNMRDGSVLVNTARGPIVEEDDLLAEIESGRLRAIFDVFWQEPYNGHLKAHHPDRFVMSPHIASHCKEFVESLAKDFRNLVTSMGYKLD